jgi:heme A synthase
VITLRRLSYLTLGIAFLHLVFGAIVRITDSGMGCGPHWPDCNGYLFPPLDRPKLVIEITHRYLAIVILLSAVATAVTAWARRDEPGVGGRGGVLRSAILVVALWFAPALLGAATVWLENVPDATIVHQWLALALLAVAAITVVRAGGLGGASARAQRSSARTARGAIAAAVIALLAAMLGAVTANFPGASWACPGFPLCASSSPEAALPAHVQMAHRIVAFLLFFHLLGFTIGVSKRGEAPVVVRAARVAFGLVVLQILVAGAMIGLHLPAALRSLHQAVGISIWLSVFTLAYLARIATGRTALTHAGAGTGVSGSSAAPATATEAVLGFGTET